MITRLLCPVAALMVAGGALAAPMQARDSDDDGNFLGQSQLPESSTNHSIIPNPAEGVLLYFQGVTHDPNLELQLQGELDEEDEVRFAFVQSVNGVPILGTFAVAQVQGGALHYARHFLIHTPLVDTSPTLPASGAQSVALSAARPMAEGVVPGHGAPYLAVFLLDEDEEASTEPVPYLVWVVPVSTELPHASWELFIQANDARVLATRQTSVNNVTGNVMAMAEASCQGDVQAMTPLPYVEFAQGQATEEDGTFLSPQDVDQSRVRLQGPFFRVEDYEALVNGGSGILFSTKLHRAPAYNHIQVAKPPIAAVDAFVYASIARKWVRQRLAEMPAFNANRIKQWLNSQLPIRVNLPSGHQGFRCNAFYDGQALNFYVADKKGGCINSARSSKIVFHEYGHGVHDHLTWSRATFDAQVSEGVSDYLAATITGDPNITGLLGCNLVLPGRTTMRTCVNHYTYCRHKHCNSRPFDEVHNAAPILCAALWELRQSLGPATADHLFLRFLSLATDMNSAYEAAIAADDDEDGDPTNGTVHSCEINRAFLGAEGGIAHFPDAVKRAVPCDPSPVPAP